MSNQGNMKEEADSKPNCLIRALRIIWEWCCCAGEHDIEANDHHERRLIQDPTNRRNYASDNERGIIREHCHPSNRPHYSNAVGRSIIEDHHHPSNSRSVTDYNRRVVKDPLNQQTYTVESHPLPKPYIGVERRNVYKGIARIFYDERQVRIGTVAWTGYRAEHRHFQSHNNLLVVLHVDQFHSSATNGVFDGQELVKPAEGKHFVMLPYIQTKDVPVFEIGDYCVVLDEDIAFVVRTLFHGGFIRKRLEDNYYKFDPLNTDYREDDHEECTYPAYRLIKAPIPETIEISGLVDPISNIRLDKFFGRNKGIQGRHNSCYLDTILFSFFAFSNQFDHILFDSHENMHHEYLVVLNVLRHHIINPLRACHFVSFQQISELRKMMASRIDKRFEGDSRDIPESVNALFGTLLQVEPFLSIGQSTKDQSFFDGSYTAECIGMGDEKYPTSKLLLENAAVQMDFSLEKMPKCFILQLPRESERDGFVLPSYTLDLQNLLHRGIKVCKSCRCNATLQFPQMMKRTRDIAGTFVCDDCANSMNLDSSQAKRLPESDISDLPNQNTEVEMSAVICIEKSHYNCYVRCGDRWIFFDSMSDQETLENPATHQMEVFNIPLVEEVRNFRQWLSKAERTVRDKNSLDDFFSSFKNRNEHERAYRLLRFPYCIIYRLVEI